MSRWICVDDIGSMETRTDQELIDSAPSIDIVRCKECRWASPNGKYGCMLKPFSKNDWQYHHLFSDDFCSYGERREP